MPENNQEPYVLNPQTGRKYYGKALGSKSDQEELWTDRPYQSGYDVSHPYLGRFAKIATAGAAYGIARKYPSVWDAATHGARVLEDISPFKWGRTFQISNILSHREKSVLDAQWNAGKHWKLNHLQGDRTAEYLSHLTSNKDISERAIKRQGVTLKQGTLYLGKNPTSNSQVILQHAGVIRLSEAGASSTFGDAYIKTNVPDFDGGKNVFGGLEDKAGKAKPSISASRGDPNLTARPIQFIGGDTAFQYHLRRAKAIGAEFGVYRFNRLLSEDFQQGFLSPLAKKLQRLPHVGKYFDTGLGVRAGTPLKTAFHLGKKLGMLFGVVPLVYKQADWMAEQVAGSGITQTVATAGVAAHIGYAHLIESATPFYKVQEYFEENIPGITNPWNVLKFGLPASMMSMTGSKFYEVGRAISQTFKMGTGEWSKENFASARSEIHRRYTDFNFGEDNYLKAKFQRYGTSRAGSVINEDSMVGAIWRKVAEKGDDGILNLKLFGVMKTKATPAKVAGMWGLLASSVLWLPGVAGFLVPDERPDELEAIYSGRKEVPVRRGRFWEFGRGSMEGEDIMYYRPGWYARMKSKYKDKAIWQDDQDLSPIRKFFLKEFTYHLEEKHYNSRPYPVSALSLEDVPGIGWLLSNTIGRLIKPPTYMHTEEWRDGGAVKVEDPSFGKIYATELGETPGGIPVSPYGLTQSISKGFYHLTEQAGLWGYATESAIDSLTGTPGVLDQYKVMSSFRDVTSATRDFYDLGLGGQMMTNEPLRRLLPAKRGQIDTYNPLRNEMPSWIPGSGSRGINFHAGDPYTKIAEGELRLPGVGYAARFRELEGVDPEDYPLIHKYKILADVAPYSNAFKKVAGQMKGASSGFDDWEMSIYEATKEQLSRRRDRKEFSEYKNSVFGQGDKYGADHSSGALAGLNNIITGRTENTGILGTLFAIPERILHWQSPIEYLYPLSPESKFNPRRTSIESYERENIYGTTSAFWNSPFDDFISPTVKSIAHNYLGWDGVPGGVEKVRDLEEYFDVLEYVKYSRLSNIARLNRDEEAKQIFEQRKDETLFGVNPYTMNDASIYRGLPSRDKAYFRAFSEADSPEKRRRILELVPRNQRELYLARWKLEQTQDFKQARNATLNTQIQGNVLSDRVNDVYQDARDEGFPKTPGLHQRFMSTKYQGENYSDWYRRTQLLPDVPLPQADWIGWHPSVDLEDIKLKMVVGAGENMHDYGFYDTQLRALGSKPFLEGAVEGIMSVQDRGDSYGSRRNINEIFAGRRMQADIGISKHWGPGSRPEISVDLE